MQCWSAVIMPELYSKEREYNENLTAIDGGINDNYTPKSPKEYRTKSFLRAFQCYSVLNLFWRNI